MDKILRLTLLLDFYGELLTEKQRGLFELHYLNDLSLNEIAQAYGVSPQSVGDLLRRTEKILIKYEAKLKLVEKYLLFQDKRKELSAGFEKLKDFLPREPACSALAEEMKIKLAELDAIL